jgi:radical SAM superfamily enzyme YgiQ (UPF0313 family)
MSRPDANLGPGPAGRRTLRIYFVKPSQYDAEGLVLHYRWGIMPNNTLTVLAGLNDAYAQARPEVHVQTVLWDELVDGPITPVIMRSIRAEGAADGVEVIIGLAGVQTGQYPRARDLALQFRQLDVPVAIGGFHISGHRPSREFLQSLGVIVVVGEGETTWPRLLDDYLAGQLRPCYAVEEGMRTKTGLDDITVPLIRDAALPAVDARYLGRFFNPTFSTIDTARGCPFACSYCAVKNVMGRTPRAREPARVIEWMRRAYDLHGVRSFFIVDDDFFRSPSWEPILRGLAALRREGRDLTFMMQTDVAAAADARPPAGEPAPRWCRRDRRFVELAAAAGCYAVFIGFESFSPVNLEHTCKFHNEDRRARRQNTRDLEHAVAAVKARYQRTVANWHAAGVAVHAGYMIGLPFDGKGCGIQAATDLTEIGVDLVSFFPYTPLPGAEDYERAVAAGVIADHDFNHWDYLHVVNRHPILTRREVYHEYCAAHRGFYTWRRLAWALATYYRVPGLTAAARYGMLTQQLYYTYAYRRGWHPMTGGIWRRRDQSARREVIWDDEARALYAPGTTRRLPSCSSQDVIGDDLNSLPAAVQPCPHADSVPRGEGTQPETSYEPVY